MANFHQAPTFTVPDLLERLETLSSAVIRIVGNDPSSPTEPRGLCSGWFITPRLVVAPSYLLEESSPDDLRTRNVRVQSFDKHGTCWESPVLEDAELQGHGLLKTFADEWTFAILKAEREWEGPLLELSLDVAVRGDTVSIIQFADARPPPTVSFGQLRAVDGPQLSYDATTFPGSGGSPLLDRSWKVSGVHIGMNTRQKLNVGLSRAALVEVLQKSKFWHEIAECHRFADSATALKVHEISGASSPTKSTSSMPIWAALAPFVKKGELSESERQMLEPMVVDPDAPRWVLKPDERRSLLSSVGSLANMRKHLRTDKGVAYEVVKAVLQGPPYDFAGATEDQLAWWLQISRWFDDGLAPQLPPPAEFARMLQLRRIRAPLERAMGKDFRGRTLELRQLETWYKARKAPLLLTGIGGVGKSAMIARFALKLPASTLLLWLDFDRADLAPDDPVSVLNAISEQASAQFATLTQRQFTSANWQKEAVELGKAIAVQLARRPALLVLDSFEAAQYAAKYQELWSVLEVVAQPLRSLRLAVTGRAAVPGLCFRKAIARHIHLEGLRNADARAWLQSKGIQDPNLLAPIVEIAHGVPLILSLAVRFIETGNAADDLPRKLPAALVAGYLYDRILNRVQSPELKPLARGALVLRRITEEMLLPVLQGIVEFPPGQPADWFMRLSSEMSLVEGAQTLTVRPEVRSSTLRFIEQENLSFVKSIDARAAEWYSGRNSEDAAEIAELIYHQLRQGDVAGAQKAWRPECAIFLAYADEDLRDEPARAWLKQHLTHENDASATLAHWEQDASNRILGARARRLNRNVSRILKENPARTPGSPLIFQDAFELRQRGKFAQAAELLDKAPPATGSIDRDRIALRALLANDLGDREAADALLSRVDDISLWKDRRYGPLEALCVQAARVWVRTHLDAERSLISRLNSSARRTRARRVLAPLDVALPALRKLIYPRSSSQERPAIHYDVLTSRHGSLAELIDQERVASLNDEPPAAARTRGELFASPDPTAPFKYLAPSALGLHGKSDGDISMLAQLGWQRWRYVAHSTFLKDASELAMLAESMSPPMEIAILGTLALFTMRAGALRLLCADRPLGDVILNNYVIRIPWHADAADWRLIKGLLQKGVDPKFDWDLYIRRARNKKLVMWPKKLVAHRPPGISQQLASATGLGPFLLSLVSRDPLTQLVCELAGQARDEL